MRASGSRRPLQPSRRAICTPTSGSASVRIILGCAVGIFDENAMWLAVFGDVGVCLLAVANALRVLHIRKKKK